MWHGVCGPMQAMMSPVLIGLLLLVMCLGGPLAAQETEQPPQPALGQPFELAVGEMQTIAETGLQLTFTAVTEDSRCPSNVQCIWAGRVVIEVWAQAPNEEGQVLSLSSMETTASYAGQAIELRNVSPPAQPAGMGIPAEDYRAELVVTLAN
jgi:hypothetical protein